jgi:WD40 repeat protein
MADSPGRVDGRGRRGRGRRTVVGAGLVTALVTAALLGPVAWWPWPAGAGPAPVAASPAASASAAPAASRVHLVDLSRASRDGAVVRLSRDALVLARGRADGALQVVDLAEGREQATAGAGAPVADLALSADGRVVGARASDGALIVWHVRDDEPRDEPLVLRARPGADGCDACGAALTFAPDADLLLAADGGGGLVLHDAETGARRASWRAGPAAVRDAAFSADGRWIATIDRVGGVGLWTNAGNALWKARAPAGAAERLALSADGRWLAVGGPSGVCVWDARTGRLRQRLAASPGAPTDLAFSADGSTLGILGAAGAVDLWEPASSQARRIPAGAAPPLLITRHAAGGGPVVLGRGDGAYLVWEPGQAHAVREGRGEAPT